MSISNIKTRCIESEYEPMNSQKPTFSFKKEDFKHHSFDKVRYGDTDRQGHINNAMLSDILKPHELKSYTIQFVPFMKTIRLL